MEDRSFVANQIQRAGMTAPTGIVALGGALQVPNTADTYLQFSTHFFHDRIPYKDINNYLEQILNMDDGEYNRHRDWYNLDSMAQVVRLLAPNYEFYVSIGKYSGDFAGTTGVIWRLTKKDSVSLDAHLGQRANLQAGISAFYVHDDTVRIMEYPMDFSVFAGIQWLKQALAVTDNYNGTQDCWVPTAGASATLFKRRWSQWLESRLRIVGGYQYYACDDADQNGFYTGLQMSFTLPAKMKNPNK